MTRAAVTAPAAAMDDLSVLLPDWRTHLRARNVAPSTIQSYLRVGQALNEHLVGARCGRTPGGGE